MHAPSIFFLGSAFALAVSGLPMPDLHGGFSSHGHGGHGGHGGHHISGKTIHGEPQLVHTETHGKVSHPTITTKLKLISKPYPVKVPIEIPVVKHVPVTKTFKNVKTIKVPVHITKEVPFEVVKTIKVPVKVKTHHSSIHHSGGYSDHHSGFSSGFSHH